MSHSTVENLHIMRKYLLLLRAFIVSKEFDALSREDQLSQINNKNRVQIHVNKLEDEVFRLLKKSK